MKKLTALFLAIVIMLCMLPSAYAASNEATEAAQTLYELGLFKGTGTNADGSPVFDLDKTPTRNQAVIMLVRLLGKEEEALKGDWELPFTDVPKDSTVYPYVGYAYANGLTSGTTTTTYSGGNPIKANQYITFVLRAMGYVSGEDFEVATAWDFSDKLGITGGTYTATTQEFTRGDIAKITLFALTSQIKNSEKTLFSIIQEGGGLVESARYAKPRELRYNYSNGYGRTIHYKESYVQNLTVAKIGSLYQFKISLVPDRFSCVYFFPAGLQGGAEKDKYSKTANLFANVATDDASFFVDEDIIFNNPVHQTRMVLKLNAITTAFPDDFQFAEGSRDTCILLKINARDLPK